MRKKVKDSEAPSFLGRRIFMLCLVLALSVFYIFRLANLQIVEGASYNDRATKRMSRSLPVAAPRGEILDRYGRAFVKNSMGFTVMLDKVTMKSDTQNQVILDLLAVLENGGYSYKDGLPISISAPFSFLTSEDEEEAKKLEKAKAKLFKTRRYKEDVTAEAAMADLAKRYKIVGFSEADTRKIAGMRYEMELSGFSLTTPYTVATNVDIATVTILRERYESFQGVSVETQPVREYVGGNTAAHILGNVGQIYAEEAAEYREKGYLSTDLVGKSGVEKSLEEYLRGFAGTKTIEQNAKGKVTDTTYSAEPQPGNNVMLTIDKKLQEITERSLEENIKKIAAKGKADGGTNSRNGWDASAGACVVMKVDTGEVLSMASYPTYDPTTFNSNFTALNSDPLKPMLNRAISGRYEPGSTFKMATALAGLEEGVMNTGTRVLDKGKYTFYKDYQPNCWLFTDTGRTHGNVNVEGALRGSCNYYFYEMGRLLGIDKLNDWCKRLGMGQKTGIELPGESAGMLAGPEQRDKTGERWWGGDTLQASIGQSDNLLTPLQLANYVSTIVNGGTRYTPTILHDVRNYITDDEVKAFTPKVAEQLDISDEIYRSIMAGMGAVTEDGTASNVFGPTYPIKVGGKTGTASVPSGSPTGVFVAFAPFDKPEIAIAIVVEHGAHGNTVAPVAKDIFDEYFGSKALSGGVLPENRLLG